jgi:hypothetical protein
LREHPYGALPIKGWEEKIRKDHIKALDKGDLVLIIFGLAPYGTSLAELTIVSLQLVVGTDCSAAVSVISVSRLDSVGFLNKKAP